MRCDNRRTEWLVPDDGWLTSSYCGPNGGNCVEVNLGGAGVVGLRDSKFRDGPVLLFDGRRWRDFLETAREGGFDW